MSVIVKGGGGGKKEGLYCWDKKESDICFVYSAVVLTTPFAVKESDGNAVTVYYSTSFTKDDETGLITLESPLTKTVSNGSSVSISSGYYFSIGASQSNIVFYSNSNSATVRNNYLGDGWVSVAPYSSSYPTIKYAYEEVPTYTTISYVIDNNPEKYPNGEVYNEYYYEKPVEPVKFGLIKFAQGSFVLTTDQTSDFTLTHNLGVRPKLLVMYTDDDLLYKQYVIRSLIAVDRHHYGNESDQINTHKVVVEYTSGANYFETYSNGELNATLNSEVTDTTFILHFASNKKLLANKTYHWAVFG